MEAKTGDFKAKIAFVDFDFVTISCCNDKVCAVFVLLEPESIF